jgi:DivIVA domain-containing protein
VDQHSIERIRSASFSHSVRGYHQGEVDQFLAELADWLERGGEDEAAVEAVRAELERIGEQTAGILTEAHDAAESIREDAAEDARKQLVDTNMTAEKLRSSADEYAQKAREDADAYARKTRSEVDAYVEKARPEVEAEVKRMREQAEAEAAESRQAAEREAKRIVGEANTRKDDTEALISDLEQRRDAVLAELDRLASGIAGTATQHRPPQEETNGEREADAEVATAVAKDSG